MKIQTNYICNNNNNYIASENMKIPCDSTDHAYSNKVYTTRTCVDTKGEIV